MLVNVTKQLYKEKTKKIKQKYPAIQKVAWGNRLMEGLRLTPST